MRLAPGEAGARPQARVPRDAAPRRTIELQVDDVRRLFHALDPLPYREKDVDPEGEDFVVDWACELRPSGPAEIVIHAPAAEPGAPQAPPVEAAVQAYFAGRAVAVRRQHRDLLGTGRASLAIGLGVLAACSIAARLAADLVPGDLGRFLAEGLIILGWVAQCSRSSVTPPRIGVTDRITDDFNGRLLRSSWPQRRFQSRAAPEGKTLTAARSRPDLR